MAKTVAMVAHITKNNSLDSIIFLVGLVWFKHLALFPEYIKQWVHLYHYCPLFCGCSGFSDAVLDCSLKDYLKLFDRSHSWLVFEIGIHKV
jgi:hypothetical protein